GGGIGGVDDLEIRRGRPPHDEVRQVRLPGSQRRQQEEEERPHRRCSSLNNLYSTLSTSASQLASMMLSCTPTVPQVSVPSVLSMMTRVLAAVPLLASTIRTLKSTSRTCAMAG